MSRRNLIIAAILVSFAQIGFLSWVIANRAMALRNGQEVLLKVEPVDPRDLLRGDYVVLTYEIRNVPSNLVSNPPVGDFSTQERTIFVRLGKDEDGYWRPRSASLDSAAKNIAADEVDIRGTLPRGWRVVPDDMLTVTYGIDRYYVPEGEGRAIEIDMRERPFGILAAVGRDGTPQIKALLDGQTVLYEEPPY